MPRRKSGQKAEHQHHYFRVVITYSDGETSGNRVFKDRAKAEWWAARHGRFTSRIDAIGTTNTLPPNPHVLDDKFRHTGAADQVDRVRENKER